MRDVYSGQAVHHCPLSAQMDSGVTMVQNVAARAIRATWTTTAIMAFAPELESEMVIFGHELCDVALAGENECFKFF